MDFRNIENIKEFLEQNKNYEVKIDLVKELSDQKDFECLALVLKFFKFVYPKNTDKEEFKLKKKNLDKDIQLILSKSNLRHDCVNLFYIFKRDESFDRILNDNLITYKFKISKYRIEQDNFYENFSVFWEKNPTVAERRIMDHTICNFYTYVHSIIHLFENKECEEKYIKEDFKIASEIFDSFGKDDHDFMDFPEEARAVICLYKLQSYEERECRFLFTYTTLEYKIKDNLMFGDQTNFGIN